MMNRLPSWFRQEIPGSKIFETIDALSKLKVNTVCQEAKCPNLSRCFKRGELAFIILGDKCTRSCSFCNVAKALPLKVQKGLSLLDKSGQGIIPDIDDGQPQRIKRAVEALGLNYVVITSVTRDDLIDGGAGHFAKTIRLVRDINKDIRVEALIPDFSARLESLEKVIVAGPCVLAHNLETVRRLYPQVRSQADYVLSLQVLNRAKKINPDLPTKSSLMLGMGETEEEVKKAMQDLRDNRCDILTLGQYLAPSDKHYPVKEFILPERFGEYKELGRALGFAAVLSGPLVRSSYQAREVYKSLFKEVTHV